MELGLYDRENVVTANKLWLWQLDGEDNYGVCVTTNQTERGEC